MLWATSRRRSRGAHEDDWRMTVEIIQWGVILIMAESLRFKWLISFLQVQEHHGALLKCNPAAYGWCCCSRGGRHAVLPRPHMRSRTWTEHKVPSLDGNLHPLGHFLGLGNHVTFFQVPVFRFFAIMTWWHESYDLIGTLANAGRNQSLHQECGSEGLSVSPALDLFAFLFWAKPRRFCRVNGGSPILNWAISCLLRSLQCLSEL